MKKNAVDNLVQSFNPRQPTSDKAPHLRNALLHLLRGHVAQAKECQGYIMNEIYFRFIYKKQRFLYFGYFRTKFVKNKSKMETKINYKNDSIHF